MPSLRASSNAKGRVGVALATGLMFAAVLTSTTTTSRADEVSYWLSESLGKTIGNSGYVRAAQSQARQFDEVESRPRRSGRSAGSRGSVELPVASNPRRRSRGVEVASLGDTYLPRPSTGRSLSGGGGINWAASSSCLNPQLASVIAQVAANFGSVTVSSTCRSHGHNARVGGAPRSLHLTGNAADFRVHGNVSAAYSFLRSHGSVGGLKHYGGGLFHIDTGARRPF